MQEIHAIENGKVAALMTFVYLNPPWNSSWAVETEEKYLSSTIVLLDSSYWPVNLIIVFGPMVRIFCFLYVLRYERCWIHDIETHNYSTFSGESVL